MYKTYWCTITCYNYYFVSNIYLPLLSYIKSFIDVHLLYFRSKYKIPDCNL